jgi:superfamily I DNA/RNA helicase
MHRAKGLEYKAVLLIACTAKLLPFHLALSKLTDPQDRERAAAAERRLLYVAMTRARDELRLTWHRDPSPFLAPLLP